MDFWCKATTARPRPPARRSSASGPGSETEGLDHELEVLRAAGDLDGFLVVDPVLLDQLQQGLVEGLPSPPADAEPLEGGFPGAPGLGAFGSGTL